MAIAVLLGLTASSAAGGRPSGVRQPSALRATLSLSISDAHKRTVVGLARCFDARPRQGALGAVAFNDGSSRIMRTDTLRLSHTYRFGPPYTVRLTCRGVNGRVASTSATIDVAAARSLAGG
jgi:hypothetical protein